MKVKIIWKETPPKLEKAINKFLNSASPTTIIVDIIYKTIAEGLAHGAMIIYKEVEYRERNK